jgi:glutamate formiminotransferase/formiminotetrahydrofolate cyclodeaminase
VAGAIGASLVAMLARVTLTSPRYASHHRLMTALAEGADEAARRLLGLARTDAAAYAAVTAARGLPRRTEAERARRAAEVQKALKGAVEVPLQVMEQCAQAIGLAKNAVECGNRNAASDGATGAELCRAALKAAAYSVRANLAAIEDEAYVKISRTRMDEMLYMGTRVATNVESYVNDLWK